MEWEGLTMKVDKKSQTPRPGLQNRLISSIANKDKGKHLSRLKQVRDYLFGYPATMKEVDAATGIMRESVCRYVAMLRKNDSIFIAGKRPCRITKHVATIWTTNPELAPKPEANQLKMF